MASSAGVSHLGWLLTESPGLALRVVVTRRLMEWLLLDQLCGCEARESVRWEMGKGHRDLFVREMYALRTCVKIGEPAPQREYGYIINLSPFHCSVGQR